MDLVENLRKKIENLDSGEHVIGLKAVLQHIETGFKHYSRGQETGDDTSYTDAIYRSNQAFEGSIKEAYRVLAAKDPQKTRPFDIESYLEKHDIFRPRILKQFTSYRTEWRNPSTHDYRLDFDEREAFLALVSVSAFALLLVDNIGERLAFLKTLAEAKSEMVSRPPPEPIKGETLVERVHRLMLDFNNKYPRPSEGHYNESQLIGSIYAYLQISAEDLEVYINYSINRKFLADLLVKSESDHLIIEVKILSDQQSEHNAVTQLQQYIKEARFSKGYFFVPGRANEKMIETVDLYDDEFEIRGLLPDNRRLVRST